MNIYELDGIKPIIHPGSFIAPGAHIIGNVEIHSKASVWFNAVLRGDQEKITIHEGANIQDGTVIHTDPGYPCTVGKQATVGHNVVLHGCNVGESAVIGMNATVLNGAVVGKEAFVAAGSLVTEGKTVPERALVAGVPAKPLKEVSVELLKRAKGGAEFYQKNSERFRKNKIGN
jgi:carbonic anhydrase/acetyltransferase-like protein (isoleucine patch superfamily)